MKYSGIILLLLCWVLLLSGTSSVHSQNFVALDSKQALIKYIRGSGSNIGLYVGVEYNPSGFSLQKSVTGEMGVVRMFRIDVGVGGNVLKGAGQGFGKARIDRSHSFMVPQKNNFKFIHAGKMSILKVQDYTNLIPAIMTNEEENFQLRPIYDFKLEKGVISEIFLPVLCLDQDLPVPPSQPDENFTTSTMSDTVQQTYVGLYRCDKYINENIISKVWFVDDMFAWYEGELTEAEIEMIIFCHVELDSSSLYRPPSGYYDITHAHLLPIYAQWPIWAASHNQDMQSFLDGYNYIRSLQGLSPVAADSIIDLYNLNHLVFLMAEMDEFKKRFLIPEGADTLSIPNLKPYAFIQTDPNLFREQNNTAGIVFSAKYSFDVDGEIKSYKWEFDVDSIDNDPVIQIKYKNQIADSTAVILTVVDNNGIESKDTVFVPYSDGVVTKVEIDVDRMELPLKFELEQNYPNPVNKLTTIPIKINAPEFVEIQIFNVIGQEIRSLAHDKFMPGNYKLAWDGKDNNGNDVPAGLYLYQIKSGGLVHTRKLVLLR